MISVDDGCNGYSTRVIHQMVISSLGLIFEHQRSDSKFYIDYDGETVNDDSPFNFDISSVMLISQFNGTAPRASSTDILKVQYEYCDQFSSGYTNCGVLDEINMNRPILKSRICDGFYDCPYGRDENGFFADCQVSLAGNCCETYLVNDVEFTFIGFYQDKPKYYSKTSEHYILYVKSKWLTTTIDSGEQFYYLDKSNDTDHCPDQVEWDDSSVKCKSNGLKNEISLPSLSIEAIYADVITPNGRVRYDTKTKSESSESGISMGWMAFYLSMIFPITWFVIWIVEKRKQNSTPAASSGKANAEIKLTGKSLYRIWT